MHDAGFWAFLGALVGVLPALLQIFRNQRVNVQKIDQNTELTKEVKDDAVKAATSAENAVTAARKSAEEHQRLCEETAQELRVLKSLLKSSLGQLLDPKIAREYGERAPKKEDKP